MVEVGPTMKKINGEDLNSDSIINHKIVIITSPSKLQVPVLVTQTQSQNPIS